MKSVIREFPTNSTVFQEGSTGNAAYILTEGTIEISVQVGRKKTILETIKPVSVFGEMALLLKEQKRTATARTLTSAKVAEISRKDFEDFLVRSPTFIMAVLNALVTRLRKTTTQATQPPDLFLGVAETLNLLHQHHQIGIRLDTFARGAGETFCQPEEEVLKVVDLMENMNLIEKKKYRSSILVELVRPQDFLARARKIHGSLAHL